MHIAIGITYLITATDRHCNSAKINVITLVTCRLIGPSTNSYRINVIAYHISDISRFLTTRNLSPVRAIDCRSAPI